MLPAMRSRPDLVPRLLVACLVLLHLALHLATLDSLLPHGKEPDSALVRQSLLLRGEGPWEDHAWAKYPHLQSALMALVPRASRLELPPAATPREELRAHLQFAGRHLRAARLVVILLSALAIPLVYRLARAFLEPGWAAVASALFASSLLFQSFAHQARPHAGLVAPTLLALLACRSWARSGRGRELALATLACGLALGALHSGAFVLIAALIALIRRARAPEPPRAGPIALAALALALSVRLAYPFFFDQPRSVEPQVSELTSYAFPHRFGWERFSGAGFERLTAALWGYDPVLLVAALLGLVSLLVARSRSGRASREERVASARYPAAASVLVVPPLVYLLVIGCYGRSFQRFLMPVLPFVSLLAALGLRGLARALAAPQRGQRHALAGALVTGVLVTGALALTSWPCLRLALLHSRRDTYEQAAEWVRTSVDRERERVWISPIINLPLLLPTPQAEDHRAVDSPLQLVWTKYLAELPPGSLRAPLAPILPLAPGGRLPHTLAEYASTAAEVRALLGRFGGDYMLLEQGTSVGSGARMVALERGRRLTSFSPWRQSGRPDTGLTFVSDSFRRDVLSARCLGPLLEVWKLDR